MAGLLAVTLATGLLTEPAYAISDSYSAGQYIKSELADKPARTWDEIIAPQVAQVNKAKAEAKRLAAEAQAKADAEAEAQRVAREAARGTYVAPVATTDVPSQPSGNCADWMAAAGITETANAMFIIMRESGCNPNARNPNGGACGIGQQLPCGKWAHQWNDPVGGMIDMQNYVYGRYGSWANAVAYWQSHGNY